MSKNIAFTSLVKLAGRWWEFNFRKPGNPPDAPFHTDCTGPKGERIQFLMRRLPEGRWSAEGSGIPVWIAEGVDKIGAAIEENNES